MDDYATGYHDGLRAFSQLRIDEYPDRVAAILDDESTAYDLGFIAGLAAAKVRAGEDG